MPQTQDRLATVDVLIPVTVPIPVGANPITSADVVQFQFVLGGLPVRNRPTADAVPPKTTGWLNGYWLTPTPGPLLAGILVGPDGGAVALPPGRYAIWIKIVGDPTVPVQAVDQLTIT